MPHDPNANPDKFYFEVELTTGPDGYPALRIVSTRDGVRRGMFQYFVRDDAFFTGQVVEALEHSFRKEATKYVEGLQVPGYSKICPTCRGKGKTHHVIGHGNTYDQTCETCKGKRVVD